MSDGMKDFDKFEIQDVYDMADKYEIPAEVTIELNTTCNLKCKHCYIPHNSSYSLSYDDLINILNQLRELGTFGIVLTGGEIFSRKDIIKIIEKIRLMGFNLILFTNASLITDEYAKIMSDLYVSMVSISLYSFKDSIHDGITGVDGSLKKTLHGVEMLRKYNIPIELKAMIMDENYKDIGSFYETCKNNNFECKASPNLFPKSDGDKAPTDLRIHGDKLKEVLPIVNKMIRYSPHEKKSDDYVCPSMRHSFGIGATGIVNACNTMFYSLGNVHESTLSDIWYSEKARKIRNIKYGDIGAKCQKCKISSFCIRCPGVALNEYGNMFGADLYACEIASIRSVL